MNEPAGLSPAEFVEMIVVHAEVMGDFMNQRAPDLFVQRLNSSPQLPERAGQ